MKASHVPGDVGNEIREDSCRNRSLFIRRNEGLFTFQAIISRFYID